MMLYFVTFANYITNGSPELAITQVSSERRKQQALSHAFVNLLNLKENKKKKREKTLCSTSHAVLESYHLLSSDGMAEGKENDGQVEPEKQFG